MGQIHIDLPKDKIVDFCSKWHIREFSLFGSVLQETFRPESDIDVIVEFDSGITHSLFDMITMTDELKDIFGRNVDLINRKDIERSRNYIRRKEVLSTMEPVYVS